MNVHRPPTNIPLGRQGENLATCIIFDCTGLAQLYGDGTAELLHELKDGTIYPVAVMQEGASVSWTVSASDTAMVGAGRAELRWYVGDTLAKSAKFRTSVSSALADTTTETPPAPQQSWVDKVLAAAQEIKDGAISDDKLAAAIAAYLDEHPIDAGLDKAELAAYLTENGYLTDAALADAIAQALAEAKASGQFDGAPGKDGVDGKDGTQGVDGYTPVKGVDYGTPEEIAEIAQSAAEVLQPEVSQIRDDLANKLPKSPTNWEPWTAEEQAAACERIGAERLGEWEEIVTVTVEETVSLFTVDKDANGNPFSLSQIICELIIPEEISPKARSVYFALEPHPNKAFSRAQVSSATTVQCGVVTYARVVGGRVICNSGIGGNIPNRYQIGTNVSIFNGYGSLEAELFDSISVFTYNDAFPAGCKFIIRGIRK